MRKFYFFWVFILAISFGCSKEDDSVEIAVKQNASFDLVGINTDAVFQYKYDGISENGTERNLSNELGMGTNYLTLRQVGQTLSFYTFRDGKFSLFQKNITSGEIKNYIDFYTNTTARSIVWGTNSESSVFFGFYNPQGTTNLSIRNIALNNLVGSDLSLEFNIERLYQPLYHQGKLFITYKSNASQYKIGVYNTDTNQLLQTILYGTEIPSILINDNGDLVVFRVSSESNTKMDVLDINTLEKVQESIIALKQIFNPGPINAKLMDNKLYYEYEHTQPFSIASGPAVYDIPTNTNTIIDLPAIISEIETENAIYIVNQQYDSKEGVFLISYGEFSNNNQQRGGTIVVSAEGELLNHVKLNFVPVYFIEK